MTVWKIHRTRYLPEPSAEALISRSTPVLTRNFCPRAVFSVFCLYVVKVASALCEELFYTRTVIPPDAADVEQRLSYVLCYPNKVSFVVCTFHASNMFMVYNTPQWRLYDMCLLNMCWGEEVLLAGFISITANAGFEV